MNLGKIVAGRVDDTGRDGTEIEGSIRGPCGPKNHYNYHYNDFSDYNVCFGPCSL